MCRSPIKKDYTLYINGIRVYGIEPLFEPPLITLKVEKALISAALQGKTMYDLMELDVKTNKFIYNFNAPVGEVKPIPIEGGWIKIERDKDGFVTEECLDFMMSNLPFIVACQCSNGSIFYHVVCDYNEKDGWRGEIDIDTDYTHYLPIPKLK